eukprot:gnl/MRDRNA2_/MRDRNA2_36169_c0_seq1.p1 gnl/MRDRNA2_/MRDRNA2_36169_c0~~gnl/MRDRNA2_/MRDRNA2_36169_c0_seq1.p1  ORF type:complete len:639 (-),score=110.25 gnl/MRDRNA2_/MRDRNA2_36169_c0_seq1:202-2118(-)
MPLASDRPPEFSEGQQVEVDLDGQGIYVPGRIDRLERRPVGSWVYDVVCESRRGTCIPASRVRVASIQNGEGQPRVNEEMIIEHPGGSLLGRPKAKPIVKLCPSKPKSENIGASVFVRVRPLLPAELAAGEEMLPGLVLESSQPDIACAVAFNGTSSISGFNGVLGHSEDNSVVFARTLQPHLRTLMRGGTVSLFSYGYTGAGKTHTVFGSEVEVGVYRLAAEQLLQLIHSHNAQVALGKVSDITLLLHATVVEVYNDSVFDLLSERSPCTLRKNSAGQLLVRGATKKQALDAAEAKTKGADFVVKTAGLTSVRITSAEDLMALHRKARAHRAVGSSTEHDQSSRSHAVFRLEIVTQPLLDAREVLEDAESIKPALQTEYAKTRKYQTRQKLVEIDSTIAQTSEQIAEMYSGESAVGGQLLLVDLAGADTDTRDLGEGHTAEQQKESQAINKSLLALKECIRGLHAPRQMHGSRKLPFRDSSITRLLEEVLVPREGKESHSTMIVNVAPAARLHHKTINSLRYGQFFLPATSSSSRGRALSTVPGRVPVKRSITAQGKAEAAKQGAGELPFMSSRSVPPWKSTLFALSPYSGHGVEYVISLILLAFFVVGLIALKKFRSFQKHSSIQKPINFQILLRG